MYFSCFGRANIIAKYYPVSRGFFLARLLAFTKPFAWQLPNKQATQMAFSL